MSLFDHSTIGTIIPDVETYIVNECGVDALSSIDEDVWDIARQSDEIPHIGNIYSEQVLLILKDILYRKYPFLKESDEEISSYVNGYDTHFFIGTHQVCDTSEISHIMAQIEADINDIEA